MWKRIKKTLLQNVIRSQLLPKRNAHNSEIASPHRSRVPPTHSHTLPTIQPQMQGTSSLGTLPHRPYSSHLAVHQSHFLESPCENSARGRGIVLQLPWQYL